MRTKLAQILESNSNNLEGASSLLEKALIGHDSGDVEVGTPASLHHLLKNGFSMD